MIGYGTILKIGESITILPRVVKRQIPVVAAWRRVGNPVRNKEAIC